MRTEEKIKQAFAPYFHVPPEAWKSFTNLGEIITTEKYVLTLTQQKAATDLRA